MEMVTHTRYSHLVETIDITSTDLEEVHHTPYTKEGLKKGTNARFCDFVFLCLL